MHSHTRADTTSYFGDLDVATGKPEVNQNSGISFSTLENCVVIGKIGGPGEVRTLDLMTASHARSQLRHRPTCETH